MKTRWYLVPLFAAGAGIGWWNAATPPPQEIPRDADACEMALIPPKGTADVDGAIRDAQRRSADPRGREHSLERLGWLYVEKARTSHDDGYFHLALQSANCLLKGAPGNQAAELIRGHVMHSLHRFAEAEQIAAGLVERRGNPFDYGLLGDVLMEQGTLVEAEAAYQTMLDLRPGLQSYSRGSHLMWLKGDVEGAARLMHSAALAGGPRTAEPTAWAYTRLAMYLLQAGRGGEALEAAESALSFEDSYAPALLARARIQFAQGDPGAALADAVRAGEQIDLPEYRWFQADLARARGDEAEANELENKLALEGEFLDPRTFALYLATRGLMPERAIQLSRQELQNRRDVFTYDALAWSLHRAGKSAAAWRTMQSALKEGTQDARLFLHAGLIAEAAGERQAAQRWLSKAQKLRQMLFPSEASLLNVRASGGDPPAILPS